jgi:arginyl-tRNA synthetase
MIEEFIFANQCWQKFGNGETPVDRAKGDKLVGIVAFDKAYKVEIAQLISEGKQKKRLKTSTNHSGSTRDVLKWEAGDEEVISLWKK